jgi:hypothetical protein
MIYKKKYTHINELKKLEIYTVKMANGEALVRIVDIICMLNDDMSTLNVKLVDVHCA